MKEKKKAEITEEKVKKMKSFAIIIWLINIAVIGFSAYALIYNTLYPTVKAAKPIIYIYPTEEMELSIELGKPETLLVSYPKYDKKWIVKSKPTGELVDLNSGKKLYSLYYENNINRNIKVENEGFVIEGEKTAEFLDEKLEIMGLNYKEREEFIIYWLPKLEANKYNYIRFMTKEEIEDNMPLTFSIQPDTLIRINMIFKGLNKPIKVEEQKIEKVERTGFTIVEWGATEIK